MAQVGILADDLSGALDAAATFASPFSPVLVAFNSPQSKQTGKFAIDTESRGLAAYTAVERVMALLPELSGCDTAFKKIDSQMRGNTFRELHACCKSKLFAAVVIAPAFPQQGRLTRGGRQFVRDYGGAWHPAGPAIVTEMASTGISVRHIGRRGEIGGGNVAICDAESWGDLQHVAAARVKLDKPVLWCGSSGLARALSEYPDRELRPQGSRRLAIAGSRHPATLAQVDHVRSIYPEYVSQIEAATDIADAIKRVGDGLDRHGVAIAQLAPDIEDADLASDLYYQFFEHLKELPMPDVVTVSGGDTLYRLFRVMGATTLSAAGEWGPGIAVSSAVDGLWAGVVTISKSGAFGSRDCMYSILESAKATQ